MGSRKVPGKRKDGKQEEPNARPPTPEPGGITIARYIHIYIYIYARVNLCIYMHRALVRSSAFLAHALFVFRICLAHALLGVRALH